MSTRFSHRITLALLISASVGYAHAQKHAVPASETLPATVLGEHTTLEGIVAHRDARLPATIIVRDQQGHRRQTQTDEQGHYQLDVSELTAPLRLSAVESGGNNCLLNNQARAICLSALLPTAQSGKRTTANINPFTDRIASDMAAAAGYIGPQQLSDDAGTPVLSAATWKQANAVFHAGFGPALKQAGITNPAQFDPLHYPATQQKSVRQLVEVINHNRNYHNDSGQAGHTVLTDSVFRPIVGLSADGSYEGLDYGYASRQLDEIKKAKTRIFIVGDSTAANYEKLRFPRMGWAQVFEQQFRHDGSVKVINGARAGRSSRDFFYEGWFRQMQPLMQPGDYIFIQMGHNDQNCNGARAVRGAADVGNLCTYPNDAAGKRQFPQGKPDMSFQNALERYITYARQHQMIPVLLTPTTRVKDAQGKDGTPAVHSHFTRQNAENGFAFIGDYSQTIKDTAKANNVPLLDVEPDTIALANRDNGHHWKQYWLVIDPKRYPYYKDQAGSTSKPDTTHFQQKGAIAVAEIVADSIRADDALRPLADYLLKKKH